MISYRRTVLKEGAFLYGLHFCKRWLTKETLDIKQSLHKLSIIEILKFTMFTGSESDLQVLI
ncbi:Uncharacterised protein [Streptococcus cristatus]|nr:Uncharacterised protein [Streptococcus cristatus]